MGMEGEKNALFARVCACAWVRASAVYGPQAYSHHMGTCSRKLLAEEKNNEFQHNNGTDWDRPYLYRRTESGRKRHGCGRFRPRNTRRPGESFGPKHAVMMNEKTLTPYVMLTPTTRLFSTRGCTCE